MSASRAEPKLPKSSRMPLVQGCVWRLQNLVYPAKRKNRKQKPFQAPRPFLLLSWHGLREVILIAGTSRRNLPLLSAYGFMGAAGSPWWAAPGWGCFQWAAGSQEVSRGGCVEILSASRLLAILSKQQSVFKRRTESWLGLFLVCALASLWLSCSGSWGLSAGKPMKWNHRVIEYPKGKKPLKTAFSLAGVPAWAHCTLMYTHVQFAVDQNRTEQCLYIFTKVNLQNTNVYQNCIWSPRNHGTQTGIAHQQSCNYNPLHQAAESRDNVGELGMNSKKIHILGLGRCRDIWFPS